METSRALQREMGGAPRPRASECRLVELMESANYSAGRGSAFDGPLSGDVQAVYAASCEALATVAGESLDL